MDGIPPGSGAIGSSTTGAYTGNGRGGTITHKPEAHYLDGGPETPVRTWNSADRRQLLAAGNSNGDVSMREFADHADKPTPQLLVLDDDAGREFGYTAGAEQRSNTPPEGRRVPASSGGQIVLDHLRKSIRSFIRGEAGCR